MPTLTITNPSAVCYPSAVDITAGAITAGSTAGLTFSYYTNSGGTATLANPNAVTTSGTYYIKGTTGSGCSDVIKAVTVIVNPLPTLTITNPSAVCYPSAVDITAGAITAGSTAGLTFSYYTNSGGTTTLANPNAVTTSGTYYIKGTTGSGCSDVIKAVTVIVNPLPTLTITNPSAVCYPSAVDITAGAITAGSTAGLTFSYYTNSGGTATLANPNAVTTSGTYYIKGTTGSGCSDVIKAVTVIVNPLPTLTITNPSAVCYPSAVDITAGAITAGSTAGLTFSYYTNSGGTATLANPNAVTTSGTYYIKGTTGSGCSDVIKAVTVIVNPLPTITVNGSATICQGVTGDVFSTETGKNNYTWTITGGTVVGGSETSNTVTIDWDNTPGAKSIAVNYNDPVTGCAAAIPATVAATTSTIKPTFVTAVPEVCINSTGNTYSTEAGNYDYVWNIPSGGTITGPSNTNTVNVTWSTAGDQTITVNYSNGVGCTASSPMVQNVKVNPTTVGGALSANQSICYNTTPANIILTGNVGEVIRWEKSNDATFTTGVISISNTTSTLNSGDIGPLNDSTYFRAAVLSGYCLQQYSSVAKVAVFPISVAGTVSADQTICSGSFPIDISINGSIGNVVKWQRASDAAFTTGVADITASANSTLTGAQIGALTVPTYFRAVIQSGVCNSVNSATVTVTVNPVSVAGTVSADQTICSGNNPVDININGSIGNVVRWQRATDAAFTTGVADITASANSTLSGAQIGALTATTYFRAVIQSGVCNSVNSATVTVTVNPVSVAGTVSADQLICSGNNPVDININGSIGNVVKWQRATDAAFTTGVADITASANSTLSGAQIGALTATTYFRAVIQSGVCNSVNSATVTVTVNPVSVAGTVSADQLICSGSNPADMTISGNVGNVVKWQRASDAAFTTGVADITASANSTLSGAQIGALTVPTYFRAVIQSGVCNSVNSATVTVTVNPVSVAGTVSADQLICSGSNPADMTISGNVGNVVKWQRASDAAFTTGVADITASANSTLSGAQIGALTAPTYFRAVIQSGVCNSVNSNAITITVSPTTIAGTVSSAQTICSGSTPSDIVLNGNNGSVVKWQRSTDVAFTMNLSDIASTASVLPGAMMGSLTTSTYFRAVVQSGNCGAIPSASVLISVDPAPTAFAVRIPRLVIVQVE